MRSLIFFFTILTAAVLTSAGYGHRQQKVGGWTPIKNLADPKVQEIASFAVTEHNKKANSILKLSRVVSGDTQVVSGVKYRLIIKAVTGGAGSGTDGNYEAVVWEKPWLKFRDLISFQQVNY